MTQTEFERAWKATPPTRIAEAFYTGGFNESVPRGMDRLWRFRGEMKVPARDWMLPCECAPHGSKIMCPGVKLTVAGAPTWFYVGVCHRCGVVLWVRYKESS